VHRSEGAWHTQRDPVRFARKQGRDCHRRELCKWWIAHVLHVGPVEFSRCFWSFAFFALLLVLTVLEELIVGYLHHRAFVDSLAEIGGGTLHQAFATSIILLLTLIPFFAFRSLAEVVGGRVLFRLFFEPRRKLDVAPATAHSEGA